MAVDANDARLQYIQNLASSTLDISRDSLNPLLAREDVAASLQQFLDGKGGALDAMQQCKQHGMCQGVPA
jgi:hypothetical protein